MNFLEQLVSEWYEFSGYYVRRNVKVGPLGHGGYEGELDVVAFHPMKKHLVHVEASTDSQSWERRELRLAKKFERGRKYIPALFRGLEIPAPEQIALLVYSSTRNRDKVGGGKLKTVGTFFAEIRDGLKSHKIESGAIPEQYMLLRTLLYANRYWK